MKVSFSLGKIILFLISAGIAYSVKATSTSTTMPCVPYIHTNIEPFLNIDGCEDGFLKTMGKTLKDSQKEQCALLVLRPVSLDYDHALCTETLSTSQVSNPDSKFRAMTGPIWIAQLGRAR